MTDDERKAIWARFDAMQPLEVLPTFKANNDAFVALTDSLSEAELGQTMSWIFGPAPLASVLASRLNEQALHAWDIKWVHDKHAKLTPAAVPDLVDANVPARVGRLAQPGKAAALNGKTIQVRYTQPDGALSLKVGAETVEATPGHAAAPDLTVELPAEALVRLIWGRYDIADRHRIGRAEAESTRSRGRAPEALSGTVADRAPHPQPPLPHAGAGATTFALSLWERVGAVGIEGPHGRVVRAIPPPGSGSGGWRCSRTPLRALAHSARCSSLRSEPEARRWSGRRRGGTRASAGGRRVRPTRSAPAYRGDRASIPGGKLCS